MPDKTCIRMKGTRTGKMRARVEEPGKPAFEVTVGSHKWQELPEPLRTRLLQRAFAYVRGLHRTLVVAECRLREYQPVKNCSH